MRPDDADRSYLIDMLHHARGAVESVHEMSYEHYAAEETLRLATERRIEIIGEAARLVSEELKANYPDIPWQKIVAQRHVLAHEYGEIEDELIWRVVTVHLPKLIGQLQAMTLNNETR